MRYGILGIDEDLLMVTPLEVIANNELYGCVINGGWYFSIYNDTIILKNMEASISLSDTIIYYYETEDTYSKNDYNEVLAYYKQTLPPWVKVIHIPENKKESKLARQLVKLNDNKFIFSRKAVTEVEDFDDDQIPF